MNDKEKLHRARVRVEAVKGLYVHVAVFVVVMTLLLVINLSSGSPMWVLWPFLGWGLGLIGHGVMVYGQIPKWIADWENRKLKEYMDQDGGTEG